MRTMVLSGLLMLWGTGPVLGHFIFIVPEGQGDGKAKVVFSEGLEPDEAVDVKLIGKTRLRVDGKGVSMTEGEQAYRLELPKGARVVGGECRYGVLQRGQSKPFLLMYYPKLILGSRLDAPRADLPLEIVATSKRRFVVLFQGKPVSKAEVHVVAPLTQGPIVTGEKGEFELEVNRSELYGLRARYIEQVSGEFGEKKYDEVRHYATLVFRGEAMIEPAALPPLPRAVASFGADVSGEWLYVYGGHCARTHSYSTEAVVGSLHRLNLTEPREWETLPGGPGLQGLALVAHGGKLYRIGGMEPRNPPREKADNHSVAQCARFDPQTGRWEALPDLPQPRSSHDAVVVGDRIYVIGGWWMKGCGQESQWHETALVLDLSRHDLKWESIAQPFRRRALAVARFGTQVYVLGGLSEDNEIHKTVHVLDTNTGRWSEGPSLPGFDRNGFAPSAYTGRDRPHAALADGRIIRLSDMGQGWEEIGRLKQPRIAGRMVIAGDQVIVLGGAAHGDNFDVVDRVRLP